MRFALLFMWLPAAAMAAAFEPGDIDGLSLRVESIAETIAVDGLPMQIARAEGADVLRLAQRIQQRWQREGSDVSSHLEEGWQIASRLHRDRHEVIQWRGSGDSAQLLQSAVSTSQPSLRIARAPFPLPPQCAWGRVIEGTAGPSRFEQHMAWCQASSINVARSLQARLSALGWTMRGSARQGWELDLDGTRGRVTLADGPGKAQCALMWIGVRQNREAGP